MIIGSRNVNSLLANISDLKAYSISLVPNEFRHVREIVDNQKYYIALALRDNKTLKYEMRKSLCEKLLEGVALTGTLSEFIEIREVYDFVDFNKLMYNLFKDTIKR